MAVSREAVRVETPNPAAEFPDLRRCGLCTAALPITADGRRVTSICLRSVLPFLKLCDNCGAPHFPLPRGPSSTDLAASTAAEPHQLVLTLDSPEPALA